MTGQLKEKVQKARASIEKNKRLAVILSIFVILVSAGLMIWFLSNGGSLWPASSQKPDPYLPPVLSTPANNEVPKSPEIEVLPQQERSSETEEDADEHGSQLIPPDPFSAPPALVGVLLCNQGKDLAIIEAGDNAFVASRGDLVAGFWVVQEINRNSVLLAAGDKTLLIRLPGR